MVVFQIKCFIMFLLFTFNKASLDVNLISFTLHHIRFRKAPIFTLPSRCFSTSQEDKGKDEIK